ncbi:hypothetical protein GCM10010495_66060 [Kitasatospora herbaricolor]|uniref:hypothetical protein n=1 Tax=Kitasatospora herbaricolor TaxID=68217 RepID=UPI00174E5B8F|nr:hypothetical protein [Kitasatospora herbaricolor]MDQ0307960.1 hypothetical protein [Kitasatospora herbaricolor]GGV39493.1 hypothetical protein GCM10010495_66060 [Kitasatospora herbaricolor]
MITGNLKRFGWAAALLAVAFPSAAGTVLSALTAVAAVLLAHPTVACTVAAGLLLASTLPALRHRIIRIRRRWQLHRAAGFGGLTSSRLTFVGDR